jgi:hypothetical protein
MRLFGGRNKRDSGSNPLITGSGVPNLEESDVSSAGSTLENENALHSRPRRLGELVKTLNCADSRKERVDDRDMNQISWQQLSRKESNKKPSLRSRFQQEESKELFQKFRPVLITVQDSPVAMSPPNNQLNRTRGPIGVLRSPLWQQHRKASVEDPSTRITIGLDEPKPLFLIQQRSTLSRKRSGPNPNVREDQKQVSWPSAVKPPAPKISPEDAARASKWRNGLQYRWKPQESLRAYSDGESTVASRSVMTGCSDTSEYTGYTTDLTDEAIEEDPYNARNRQRKLPLRARCRARQAGQGDNSLFDGVAEDLGVVAGMLFMDGSACFTCVAETTQESVVSCKPEL